MDMSPASLPLPLETPQRRPRPPLALDTLFPFQTRILRTLFAGRHSQIVFSAPRGNSKSYLAARAVSDVIWPGSPHFAENQDCVLLAANLNQARIVFAFLRTWLEGTGEYAWQDSANVVGVRHKETNVRCRVISSDGKGAFGLGARERIVVADEPGAWLPRKGQLMRDALETSLGKPGANLVILWIGTIAPAERGWWPDLVRGGSQGRTAVFAWIGSREKWRQRRELWRVNPLLKHFEESRVELLDKLERAKKDETRRGAYLSYRLNCPTADETELLLTEEQATALVDRERGDREGKPIVGIDLGANRAWSAACAIWPSGLVDALAVAPGLPDIAAQEERDSAPEGTYQALVDGGKLIVAEGLHVPPVAMLVAAIREHWGEPESITCDRFRISEIADAAPDWSPEARTTRWSESGFDIRALREQCSDGPFSIEPAAIPLVAESLAVARVQNDDAGGVRLKKAGTANKGRDDVAAALVLAAGAFKRDGGGSLTVCIPGGEVVEI